MAPYTLEPTSPGFGRFWPSCRHGAPTVASKINLKKSSNHLVGGFNPLKNMSSSVGMMIIPNIWKVKKFVFQTTSLSHTNQSLTCKEDLLLVMPRSQSNRG